MTIPGKDVPPRDEPTPGGMKIRHFSAAVQERPPSPPLRGKTDREERRRNNFPPPGPPNCSARDLSLSESEGMPPSPLVGEGGRRQYCSARDLSLSGSEGLPPSPLVGEGGRRPDEGEFPRLPVARPLIRPSGAPSPTRGEGGKALHAQAYASRAEQYCPSGHLPPQGGKAFRRAVSPPGQRLNGRRGRR